MYAGEVVEPVRWPRCSRTHSPLHARLLDCIPVPGMTRTGEPWATFGVVPRIAPGFVGCGFRERCTLATHECAEACRCATSAVIIAISAGCRRIGSELPRHDACDRSSNVYREFQQRAASRGPSPGPRGGRGDVLAPAGDVLGWWRVRLRKVNACRLVMGLLPPTSGEIRWMTQPGRMDRRNVPD